jgi:hypothetical protein
MRQMRFYISNNNNNKKKRSPSKNSWKMPIIEEINHEIECSEQYLSELMEQYQHIVTSIHTKRAAMEILGF